MDLLERYLQAVGQYLSPETREDVLAELRANLLAEMEDGAERQNRPLTEAEIKAVLQAHGRPIQVAARYLPQRYLIGPAAFPVYLLTLRKALPLVLLIYFLARASVLIFSGSTASLMAGIGASFAQLVPVLLIFWATVTIVFAALEYAHSQFGMGAEDWDPATLPALARSAKERSRFSKIADLAIHCLWMVYVCAIPSHPYLVLGPGAGYLASLHVAFAPVWRIFYALLIVLLVTQLLMKIGTLFGTTDHWKGAFELFTKLFGIGSTGMLALTSVYFVPADSGADLATIATVSHWMNVSFRIALFFAIVDLLTSAWKYGRRLIPSSRLAF